MQVSSVNVGNRIVPIFDSRIIYPISYLKPVSTDIVNTLTIPSSRYYYLSNDGHKIPYLASGASEQVRKDVKAWQASFSSFNKVYVISIDDASTPYEDLFKITRGIMIRVSRDRKRRYFEELKGILEAYANYEDVSERFEIPITGKLVKQMINHPFNPSANFITASQLAQYGTNEGINQYLKSRGIFHFTADDLNNLSINDTFFYLTRFYGPPMLGDLESKAIRRKYERNARNVESINIASRIPENIRIYSSFKNQFDAYFNAIVTDPDQEHIWTGLGANNKDRFYNSFFDYLELLGRPNSLPPLTLNTIKQLNANRKETLISFLKKYIDEDIVNLVGSIDLNFRNDFLLEAAERLLQTKVFILRPYEAILCNNRESAVMLDEFNELEYPFLGRGSLANGFDCYTLQELIDTFESNRTPNGIINFKDPLHYESTFRVVDLRDFTDTLRTGRGETVLPQEIIDLFDNYVQQAELQKRSDYQQILQLRQWAKEDPANAEIMLNFWTSYFHMGMYMRQWKGPGNPYPVRADETGEEAGRGTATETEIMQNVTQEKIKMNEYMDQMPDTIREIIRGLFVVKRYHGRVEPHGRTIYNLYTEVITRGVYCIRMASGPWAYTGAYYLKQIINKNIPGFNLGANVEYIQ